MKLKVSLNSLQLLWAPWVKGKWVCPMYPTFMWQLQPFVHIKCPAAAHLSQFTRPGRLHVYNAKVKHPENVVTLQKALQRKCTFSQALLSKCTLLYSVCTCLDTLRRAGSVNTHSLHIQYIRSKQLSGQLFGFWLTSADQSETQDPFYSRKQQFLHTHQEKCGFCHV